MQGYVSQVGSCEVRPATSLSGTKQQRARVVPILYKLYIYVVDIQYIPYLSYLYSISMARRVVTPVPGRYLSIYSLDWL